MKRKQHEITDIIASAIVEAADNGYTKPHDIALHIKTALNSVGLKIVNKPRPKCTKCGSASVAGSGGSRLCLVCAGEDFVRCGSCAVALPLDITACPHCGVDNRCS